MRLAALIPAVTWMASAADNFIGVSGGVSTLSADARISGSPPERVSAYKPENGGTASIFGGRNISNYFSAQVSYSWNRNSIVLSGSDLTTSSSFDLPVIAAMHSVVAEAMVFFRPRASAIRPYLSAGPGVVRTVVNPAGPASIRGNPDLPPERFNSNSASLRVAVGIDILIARGWAFRYSFSETIQRNPFSRQLRPPGERNLANFQNWWGVLWAF